MREYLYQLATDRKKGHFARICRAVLCLFACAYGLLVRLVRARALQNRRDTGVKVIGVGNITLGGTGKTTLVEYIVRFLVKEGRRVAVLSRGYKKADEPLMLQDMLGGVPVIVDKDRLRGALRARREYGADTLVLDDAFQQWRVEKDLDIVVIDATNPFGNERLLPRGILREELRALGRADCLIITKTNLRPQVGALEGRLRRFAPRADIFTAEHLPCGVFKLSEPGTLLSLKAIRGRRAVLFCGIGDPVSFEALIRGAGVIVDKVMRFDDHHWYTDADVQRIVGAARGEGSDLVITTRKDAVRLKEKTFSDKGISCYVLGIALSLRENEERFFHRLRDLYTL
ncbi:MAG: tetraacyldisaccharide 4'-kinase [Candidatus Omnitrophica bacterium]|nr:tetraacyldisaccharide 4'-kinase [Candidatus Omnitrophota bacterium]